MTRYLPLIILALLIAACAALPPIVPTPIGQQATATQTPLPAVQPMATPTEIPPVGAEGIARLRVLHAAPGWPAIDIFADQTKVGDRLEYRDITGYATIEAGAHEIQIFAGNANQPPQVRAQVSLEAGQDYTLAAYLRHDELRGLLMTDVNTRPDPGFTRIRFVHLAPGAPPMDLALGDALRLFFGVTFADSGGYAVGPADTYDLTLQPIHGEPVVVKDLPFGSQGVYTVFAIGLQEGEPELEALAVVDVEPARTE